MALLDFLRVNKVKKAVSKGGSDLDEVLAPLIQAITIPNQSFNTFSIKKATDDGYKATNMVYRCVNLITNNMVTLDFEVVGDDGQAIEDHPVDELLDNPCPEIPPNIVKAIWWKQLELTGSTFIRFNMGARPEMWPLYPDKVRILPSLEPGQLIKGYNFVNNLGVSGNNVTLLPDEVIHLRQVDPADGLQGVSALRASFRHVDILSEMDKWNYNSFLNRVLADIVISLKAENIGQDEILAIRESIERQIAGSDNARKAIIALGGTSVDRLSNTAVEMDFVESKKLTREEVAVAYGVPLPMLGVYDNGTFSNVESAKRDFWEDTLVPKADDFCDTLTWFFRRVGMLADNEKVIYKKQNIKALQRNYTERVKDSLIIQTMLQKAGYENKTVMEEINRKFELGLQLDALDEAPPQEFDEFGNPLPPNATPKPKKDTNKDKGDPPKGSNEKKSANRMSDTAKDFHWRFIDRKRSIFEDAAKYKIKKLFSNELDKLLTKITSSNKVDFMELMGVLRENEVEWSKVLTDTYRDAGLSFGARINLDSTDYSKRMDDSEYERQLKEHVDGFINKQVGLRVAGIKATTMKDIERIIKRAIDRHALIQDVQEELISLDVYLTKEVPAALRETYSNFEAYRALRIARTEVASVSGFGMNTAFSLSGARYKQWMNAKDGHVRDAHLAPLDGSVVEVDATFRNGAKFPGDPAAGASQIINCRCTMIPLTKLPGTPEEEEV